MPYLVKYIDYLTNIYVRLNRKRFKGRTGEEDCRISLSTLYHVSIYAIAYTSSGQWCCKNVCITENGILKQAHTSFI